MDPWKPAQYDKFKAERSQPFFDLLALVEARAKMRVIDLGCGTGELTRALHEKLGARETLGIDSSAAMLKSALANSAPGLLFQNQSIESWADHEMCKFDLIFSNAAIQWVPAHLELLGKISRKLGPGGQIAVQIPANHDHVSHAVAAQVAQESPFREALSGYTRTSPVLKPEEYAEALFGMGGIAQTVQLRVYGHVLESRDSVFEWVKGTVLTDYERRLEPAVYEKFLTVYRKKLLPRLEDEKPYFYPFKRILFWAKLP